MTTRHRHHRARAEHRISGPAELLQAVPYLLGFHPHDSLVLIGLHEAELVVTARLDLPAAEVPDSEVRELLEQTIAALVRGGTSALVAAIYAEAPREDGWRLTAALLDAVDALDCTLLDILLVSDGRWRSQVCDEPDCCPIDGRPLPAAPSVFAAAAAFDGVVALPDREALAAQLQPLPAATREALDAALGAAEREAVQAALEGRRDRHERAVKRGLFAAARAADEPHWAGIDDALAARFGAALPVTAIRDALWLAVDDGRIDGRPLWRELARRLPGPYAAPPLFLFGWASWRAGNGALAGIAAERAVASDPGYSAADLLLAALAHGVDPRKVPKLRLPRSA